MGYELNPREKARRDSAVDTVKSALSARGIKVTEEEIESLPCIRIFTLTDQPLAGWEEEVAAIPAVKQATERQQMREALDAGTGETEVERKLVEMRPEDRISYARAHGLDARPVAEKPRLSDAERERELKRLWEVNAAQRVTLAREKGMI